MGSRSQILHLWLRWPWPNVSMSELEIWLWVTKFNNMSSFLALFQSPTKYMAQKWNCQSGGFGHSGHNLHNLHFAKFSVLSSASLDGFSVLFIESLKNFKMFQYLLSEVEFRREVVWWQRHKISQIVEERLWKGGGWQIKKSFCFNSSKSEGFRRGTHS